MHVSEIIFSLVILKVGVQVICVVNGNLSHLSNIKKFLMGRHVGHFQNNQYDSIKIQYRQRCQSTYFFSFKEC